MRYYCTLFLRSDRKEAPSTVLTRSVLATLECTDNQTPENLAKAERMRKIGFVPRSDLPRYAWHLDTREAVGTEDCDPFVHVAWLLSKIKPNIARAELQRLRIEAKLGFYWGANGTGGGPFISPELAELLVRYGVGIDVGFYYEDADSAPTPPSSSRGGAR